jgi:hypothetical protein
MSSNFFRHEDKKEGFARNAVRVRFALIPKNAGDVEPAYPVQTTEDLLREIKSGGAKDSGSMNDKCAECICPRWVTAKECLAIRDRRELTFGNSDGAEECSCSCHYDDPDDDSEYYDEGGV